MRGPGIIPLSMALRAANTGPPRSRTVVNPSWRRLWATTTVRMATSSSCIEVPRETKSLLMAMWTCVSIIPGISVRPPPSTTVAPGALMASAETCLIMLPSTSTFMPFFRPSFTPSKTFTFVKRICVSPLGSADTGAGAGADLAAGGAGASTSVVGASGASV